MPRQAEIDQYRFVSAQDHVAGLQIEMDHVLSMNVVQGECDFRANCRDFVGWQRRFFQQRLQRGARNKLHHDIRPLEIAGGDEARHMLTRETGQDHLLDFISDYGERIFAGPQQRNLHQHWSVITVSRHAPETCHPA